MKHLTLTFLFLFTQTAFAKSPVEKKRKPASDAYYTCAVERTGTVDEFSNFNDDEMRFPIDYQRKESHLVAGNFRKGKYELLVGFDGKIKFYAEEKFTGVEFEQTYNFEIQNFDPKSPQGFTKTFKTYDGEKGVVSYNVNCF